MESHPHWNRGAWIVLIVSVLTPIWSLFLAMQFGHALGNVPSGNLPVILRAHSLGHE